MDESCKQLIGEVCEPIPAAAGRPPRSDHEYVRNGVAQIFVEVEPLTGRRHVEVGERRKLVSPCLSFRSEKTGSPSPPGQRT